MTRLKTGYKGNESPTLGRVVIVVRSLRCVGGDRPGKRYTRRANRRWANSPAAQMMRAFGTLGPFR